MREAADLPRQWIIRESFDERMTLQVQLVRHGAIQTASNCRNNFLEVVILS